MTSRHLAPFLRATRLSSAAPARAFAFACCAGIALGCGGEDSGETRVLLDMVFGPTIAIQAFNVVPDCENSLLGPEGEFEMDIQVTFPTAFADNVILDQSDVTLVSGQQVDLPLDVSFQVFDGDEVCVDSFLTYEVDSPGLDELLTGADDCETITVNSQSVDYSLTLLEGTCQLLVVVSATVSEAS